MIEENMAFLFKEFHALLGDWSALARPIAIVLILLFSWLLDLLCRKIIIPAVKKVVDKTKADWDDILFGNAVVGRLCHIVPDYRTKEGARTVAADERRPSKQNVQKTEGLEA